MRVKHSLSAAAIVAAVAAATWMVVVSAQSKPAAKAQVPQFVFDHTWPKPLPNQMKVGQVVGVTVDSRDHIWIVQRPGTLKPSEREAADGSYGGMRGAVAGCCRPAPPVIEFDQQGNMVQAWGGPQEGYDWPTPGPPSPDNALGHAPFGERAIFVDHQDNVWLGADGPGDSQVLKMSRFGRLLRQIGKKGQSKGSNDTQNLNGAAGIVVDPAANEVFIADGLRNRRVIVFDAYSGAYKRHWGAYGKPADDKAPRREFAPDVNDPQFGDVHCIALSKDKLVYVCDRSNNRIQVFRADGTFVKQGTVAEKWTGGTTYGIAFSADPEQKYAYVADGTNEKVWILDRNSLETLGSFGSAGHWGGAFTTAHSIATDSKGNVYVTETWEGKRVQRFLYKGLK
jgi:hypothetical protein